MRAAKVIAILLICLLVFTACSSASTSPTIPQVPTPTEQPTLQPQTTPAQSPTVAPETPAPSPKPTIATDTVYITRTGEKYHRANCRYLSQSKIPVERKDAISNGYAPCKVCRP